MGILIALSLNNRNEQQKNHDHFLLELDIAFNRALLINAQNSGYIRNENNEIEWIDSLLKNPEFFMLESLPVIFHRLNTYAFPSLDELLDLKIKDEVYNKNDIEQQLLINDINLFINNFSFIEKDIQQYWGNNTDFGDKLIEWGIPRITAADYEINGIEVSYKNNNYYTKHHYDIIRNKLGDQDFYDALIMLRSSKRSLVDLLNRITTRVTAFQERIAQYYPTVGTKVLSLGIIGSSLPEDWTRSVPLKYDDVSKQWKGIIELKAGQVKFRANDNWARNWGGNSFPEGELNQNGDNITVEPGMYQVIVDIIKNNYEFIETK
ncbi:MAG TPA: hypothetical protein VLM43_15460 [Desulfobacterales bacterium]|nr:hypothetical protein [Desulfobacterales bacterium]